MSEHPAFISQEVSKSAYYFFELEPRATRSLRVVCGGWESCLPHYHIDRSDFPYFSLEMVVSGSGTLVLDGRRFRLIPGTMFHYGPGISHLIMSDPAAPLEKYFVDFVGDAAVDILSDPPFSELEPLYLGDADSVMRLFHELQAHGRSRSVRSERLCSVLAELLLLSLAETGKPVGPATSVAWESFDRCRRFIESHYLTIRTLDEVSAGCHFDKPYICRLFKRFSRETPYAMLQRLKMDQAAEMLLNSRLLVKEIAAAVGFEDPYHFSHVFKRIRGVSPTVFADTARRRLQA